MMSRRILGLTALMACFAPVAWRALAQPAEDGTLTPIVAVQSGDYREARQHFQTKLRLRGPSPQRDAMPNAPAGVEVIEYPSGDLRLKAWTARPAQSERLPVVIFLHGGFSFGGEDWEMAAPYRDAGFMVVAPMLRGENGQAGVYSLFYDGVDDVIALADFLSHRPDVDPSRIFLAGHSSGATLALLAAMASTRFRAVASFSGSPDQALFTKYGMKPEQIPFDVADVREIEMRSPLSYAASLKAPARLFFGTKEPHFRLSTQKLAEIARAHGRDVQAIEIEGNHFSALAAERAQSIAFFRALQ
jgi:dipeptidyl aminopeptidase/acylaminoacyl peptidase